MRTVSDALNWAKDQLGKLGLPQSWCPSKPNNDCDYFFTEAVGSTVGSRLDIRNGSIAATRKDRRWPEGKSAKVGAGVLLDWNDGQGISHIGLVHTVYSDGSVGTYEANTGPSVGIYEPSGVYSRRRYPSNIRGYIYPPYASAAPAPAHSKSYRVVDGDNLTKIAAKFKTTVPTLVKLNDIKDPDLISIGQVIKLP